MHSCNITASVRYRLSVVDSTTGQTVRALPEKKNLILDSGLDKVAVQRWAKLFDHAAIGTGTTPVRRNSGAITLSRAGTTVTASAGFFEVADVGRLIKFNSGEEAYVTVFTNTTTVTVGIAGTVAAIPGTIWYVNVVGHAAEVKRTSTVTTASGDNGTTRPDNLTFAMTRTFIFSAETASIVYNEIGWSDIATAGANLFGRDLITGGIALSAGQQLKAAVTLTVNISSSTGVYTSVVTGWTQNGVQGLESVVTNNIINTVDSAGIGTNQPSLFDGNGGPIIELSTDATALQATTQAQIPRVGTVAFANSVLNTYVTGSFTRTMTSSWSTAEGNSTLIRSIVIWAGLDAKMFRILLNAPETKDSNHTLSFTIRLTWSRTLTN